MLAVFRSSGRRPRAVDDGTTALLGLAGVAVGRVEVDDGDRARVVHVATDDPSAACCPDCGTASRSGKAWVTTRPRTCPTGRSRSSWCGASGAGAAATPLVHGVVHRGGRR